MDKEPVDLIEEKEKNAIVLSKAISKAEKKVKVDKK